MLNVSIAQSVQALLRAARDERQRDEVRTSLPRKHANQFEYLGDSKINL